jgi:hypothetical protein
VKRFAKRSPQAMRLVQALKPMARPLRDSRAPTAEDLRAKIQDLHFPTPPSEWEHYCDDGSASPTPLTELDPKQQAVASLIDKLTPSTLLDLGANRGFYSQLAARRGARCVAVDSDEASVRKLYEDVSGSAADVLPLVMDIVNPSPGYGLGYTQLPSSAARLKSECVLMLALVHHLVFKEFLRFEHIVEGVAPFVGRWLIIEFIPRDDRYVREWCTSDHDWYRLEELVRALEKYFVVRSILPSHAPRSILMCERLQR